MANEHESGITQMWRQQPGRHDVTVDEIRTKANAFDARVQRWNLVTGLTLALLIAKNAWEVIVDVDLVERAGDLLLLVALLYVVHRFSRLAYVTTAPAALGRTSCADYYRAQLVRQRELSRDGWKYILPFVPGMALIIVGRALEGRPPSQVAALIGFALALLVGVLWVIARGARKLEREIAALESQ